MKEFKQFLTEASVSFALPGVSIFDKLSKADLTNIMSKSNDVKHIVDKGLVKGIKSQKVVKNYVEVVVELTNGDNITVCIKPETYSVSQK